MKKIISLALAACLAIGAFCMPAMATVANQTSTAYIQYGTTAHDLQAYGLHSFVSYYVNAAPQMDGVISSAEYNATGIASDVAKIGDGLTLTNNSGTTDYTAQFGKDYEDFEIKTYLAYDETYAYIAEEVTSKQAISVVKANGSASTLNVSVRYGLNQSELLPEAQGRLSNSYSYSVDSTGAVALSACSSADRVYRKLDGAVVSTALVDVEPYQDGSITWDRAEYAKAANAAASHTVNAGEHKYVFEYRIPLADVVYSATGRYNKDDVKAILESGTFYGSYLFQIAVTRTGGEEGKDQFFLNTGYAANREVLPFAGKGEATTWAKAIREYWVGANGETLSIPYVASPVVHNAKNAQVPSVPTAPASSGFRPGLTGYALGEVKSAYKTNSVVTFTVTPDCVDNKAPVVGDVRVVPTQFRVRNGFNTKVSGTFSADFTTAQFSTASLPIGINTLVVTFTTQRFDGANWVNTDVYKNVSRNFTVTGSVQSASKGASQTGDSLVIFAVAGGAMILAAGAAVVILRKKKVH